MNRETVHSVKEKSMYRNALQLNTDVKGRTNEEGLWFTGRGGKKRERERERKVWKHQGLHATEVQKKKKKKFSSPGTVSGESSCPACDCLTVGQCNPDFVLPSTWVTRDDTFSMFSVLCPVRHMSVKYSV